MHIQMTSHGAVFSTRPMAHEVFDPMSNDSHIILDFAGVEMASPSFLHETLLIFRRKAANIKMENMSASIQLQLAKAQKIMD
ncbi:MAG: DUF4325 domain-containing protein [Candidatus Pacebacteria bacterium]|nr:DUF4325 domain-containing protein [Candidatus Paceibacterota bacterium]